jgi:HlyD family secretion protein
VKQDEAALAEARVNLGYTDIISPVDGVVVSRNVDVGQTVAASFQTPTLFLIAQDLTKMQVDANVSESDIGAVANGQAVTFRVDAYPERDFVGSVVQVRNAPINVQNVITYDVVVAVDNPKLELRPGMTATITITTAKADDALRIPVRALRFRPERAPTLEGAPAAETTRRPGAGHEGARPGGGHSPAVFVPQPDGRMKRVKVEIGVQNESFAELVSGDLHEGDLVVVGYKRTESAPSASAQRPPPFVGGGGGRRFH